jgi:hypothetical protein
MEGQIGKWPTCTPQFASRSFRNVEEIAFGEEMLLAIYLQEPFPFHNYASDIDLGVDVKGYPLSSVEAEKVAVQVRTLQRKEGAL